MAISEARKKAIKSYDEMKLRALARKNRSFRATYGDSYTAQHHTQDEFDRYYSDLGELRNLTQTLKSYYTDYGTDEQKASLGDIDSALASYDAVLAEKDTVMSYYAPYASAEEFNTAYAENQAKIARNNRLATMDIDAAKAELERLTANSPNYWDKPSAGYSQSQRDKIDALKRDIEDAEKIQNLQQLESVTENDDFSDFSTGKASVSYFPYRYINAASQVDKGIIRYSSRQTSEEIDSLYDYFTYKEKGIFNYYVETNQIEKAKAYKAALEETLLAREAGDMFAFGEDHPFLASLASIPLNLLSSVEQIGRIFDGKTNQMANVSTALRSGASSEMGGLGSSLYNTGMSMADTALAAYMLGPLAESSLILSAAGQMQNDIIQRGGTKEEAMLVGLAAGIFEGFFEHFSIGELQKMKPNEIVSNFKVFVGNVGKEMGVNASEEAATELANILTDSAIMGELSNFNIALEKYKAQGMSDSEATWKVIGDMSRQVLEAGASGALMGFGFATVGGGIGVAQRTVDGKRIVQADTEGRTKKLLISDAETLFGDKAEYAEQRKLLDEVKQHLGKDTLAQKNRLGVLLQEVQKASAKAMVENAQENVSATVKQARESASAAIVGGKNADVVYEHLPEIVEYTGMNGKQIMVKGKDGEAVSLSSLSLQDEELGELYAYATTLGSVEAANSFLTYYEADMAGDGTTPTEFWTSWMGAQTLGQTLGASDAVLNEARTTYGGILSADAVTAAVIAGVNLRNRAQKQKTEAAEAYKKAWKEAGGQVKQGKFDDSKIQDELKNKATKEQKQFVQFARVFSDVFGINVTFFASEQGKRGENGRYDPKTNTIYLDLYAGIANKANYKAITACLINTLSHESVHNMAVNAPTEYFALRDYVMEVLHRQGYNTHQRIQEIIDGYAEKKQTISREQAIEEIVAAACEDMLGSSETVRAFMEDFYEKNKKAAEKFSDVVKKILENLKKLFAKFLGKKSMSNEATIISKNGVDIIAEIQKRFDTGMLALREGNMARNAANVQGNTKSAENNIAVNQDRIEQLTEKEKQEGNAVADFIIAVSNMLDQSKISKRKHKIGVVSNTHAKLIESIMQTINQDFSAEGYELWIDGTGADHINIRHGENGKADRSMASREVKMLIPWAANNAEHGDFIRDEKGNLILSNRYFNADGSKAPQIRVQKMFDGDTIYVSECVPDSTNKRIYITSAYIEKGSANQLLNMNTAVSPQLTPKASFDGSTTTNSVTDPNEFVNTFSENSDESLKQTRIETPEPSEILSDLFADKAAYAGYKDHEQSFVKYRNLQTFKAAQEKKIAEIDQKIAQLRSEKRQTGKGSRMDDLYQQRKRAEEQLAKYKNKMFAMEAKELRTIVDAETRKAVERMQKETSEKYRAKSKERTERMRMSDRRNRLKKMVKELDRLLTRGTKKKNVKEGLQDTVSSSLKLANLLLTDELSNVDIVLMDNVDSYTEQEAKYLKEYRELLAQKKTLEKELRRLQDEEIQTESFADQIDDVLNGKDTMSTHLRVSDTPQLLQQAGLPALPILMTAKHLKTITSESDSDGSHYHGLDVEIVKRLPEYLNDPILIADSLTRDDSIVVLTEAVDSQNRPVIAAIKLNGVGQISQKYISANIMTSAYGKDNIQSFLNRIADSNATIYWNEKKSQEMSVNLGVQFPNVITSLDSNVIIRQAKAFVNTKIEKISESTVPNDAIGRHLQNMDRVERRIKKLDGELKNLFEREKNRYNRVEMTRVIGELEQAYTALQHSEEDYIREAFDEYVANRIGALKQSLEGVTVKRMSEAQLREVYDLYGMVLFTVRRANKAFSEGHSQSISEMAESWEREMLSAGIAKEKVLKMMSGVKSFAWNMLLPVYAVDIIGSPTLKKLFYDVVQAEGTWARDIQEGQKFMSEMDQKYGVKDWNLDKQHVFHDKRGKEFSITLDQIMSIYAHTRQGEDAIKHLDDGGFIQSSSVIVKETKKNGKEKIRKYTWNRTQTYRLSPEIRSQIMATLTEEQKKYAEEMQAYLSTVLAEKGNQVSKKIYGIKIFNKEIYFPLRSAKQYIAEKEEKNPDVSPRLKNWGATKERVYNARNPIVLDGFRDVWAKHTAEMASYHSFTLPLEDFTRVFNYAHRGDDDKDDSSIRAMLQERFGSQAVTYFSKLIDQLNGDARVDSTTGFVNKFRGLAKTGATALSMSTLVQQPTAMLRAMAYVDPKYFMTHAKLGKGHRAEWEEIKQYAPVAILKEMGGYDTGLGAKTTDVIKQKEYQGIKEKGKALVTDSSYRNEVIFALPALADELAWCHIWAAVKKEIADTTDLKSGTEEFLQACGERFTDVIMHTQVYDSVLSRSALMRSNSTGSKMITAFAAEPTVMTNMVAYGIISGRKGNKKLAVRFIGSAVTSMIVNAAVVALVYAARDDDDDEEYSEKYVQSLMTELIEGFNPVTYIPFLRDIWSVMLGYNVERMDLSIIVDLQRSIDGFWSSRKTPWEKVSTFIAELSKLFGIPLKNLLRDGTAIFNLIQMMKENRIMGDADGFGDAFTDAAKESIPLLDRFID